MISELLAVTVKEKLIRLSKKPQEWELKVLLTRRWRITLRMQLPTTELCWKHAQWVSARSRLLTRTRQRMLKQRETLKPLITQMTLNWFSWTIGWLIQTRLAVTVAKTSPLRLTLLHRLWRPRWSQLLSSRTLAVPRKSRLNVTCPRLFKRPSIVSKSLKLITLTCLCSYVLRVHLPCMTTHYAILPLRSRTLNQPWSTRQTWPLSTVMRMSSSD